VLSFGQPVEFTGELLRYLNDPCHEFLGKVPRLAPVWKATTRFRRFCLIV
jgi:hypothetical protein